MALISEVENLKVIYSDIINGCSYSVKDNLYVKHLNDLENSEITRKKIAVYEKYKNEGLPTEEEKLAQLRESEQWDITKDDEIISLQYQISDNEKNLQKIIPQQHGPIKKIIEDTKIRLRALSNEKNSLLGRTCDEMADRKGFNYFIYLSLYKDADCKAKLLEDFDTFQTLEDEEIIKLIGIVENKLGQLSEENIKKISVLPFFLNSFSFSKDSLRDFLGFPIVNLTHYQSLLFSLGSRNLNVLNQSEGSPPDMIEGVKVNDVVLWMDKNYSILLGKRNSTK